MMHEGDDNVSSLDEARQKRGRGEDPPTRDWVSLLRRNRFGEPLPTLANATLILARDPAWSGVLGFDVTAQRARPLKEPPCHAVDASATRELPKYWTDELTSRARTWCERLHGATFTRETMREAIRLAAEKKLINPMTDYFDSLKWDGVARLDAWLVTHMRVEDSPYVRAVGSKWLISAVARAYTPGCQADYMLVVEGDQRCGKSSVLRALVPDPAWYVSTKIHLGNKDVYQIIEGKLIVVFDELDSMSKADDTHTKSFITERVDSYCKRYSREPVDQPRGCVLGGSTNERDGYLRDPTGGERYWPVRSQASHSAPLDVEAMTRARDQVWAEAVARYRAGEPWHLTDPTLIAAAQDAQESRRRVDPWEHTLRKYLQGRRSITVAELLVAAELEGARQTPADAMRAARVLTALGWWITARPERDGQRVKVYSPKDPAKWK